MVDSDPSADTGQPTYHRDASARERPVFSNWEEADKLRDSFEPTFWNTWAQGFWVVNDAELVREAVSRHDLFSRRANWANVPNPGYRMIPSHLDPPEHSKFRAVLNPWFSQAAVAKFEPEMRRWAASLVEPLVETGTCEFVADFAKEYIAKAFLSSAGLDPDDSPQLSEWVSGMVAGVNGNNPQLTEACVASLRDYFRNQVRIRQAHPRDPSTDFIAYCAAQQVDGRPMSEDEILDTCTAVALGGLDTTAAQLAWTIHHLATHRHDRRRVAEEPQLIPTAVEECLRVYPIVIAIGRRIIADEDFHGCPMRAGQMVQFMITGPNRDPSHQERATEVDLDREVVRHTSFGLGIHRCLGSHIARQEIIVGVEEWTRRIPDYDVATDEVLAERSGIPIALQRLPLQWPT